MTDPDQQRLLDEEHLRLLGIGYWITGGMAAVASMVGLLYFGMGLVFVSMVSVGSHSHGDSPPLAFGLVMACFGGLWVFVCAGVAVLRFLTARALGRRRSHTLCLITAGLSCINIPYGTFLGVCTFLVLGRPSVRAMFAAGSAAPTRPDSTAGHATG